MICVSLKETNPEKCIQLLKDIEDVKSLFLTTTLKGLLVELILSILLIDVSIPVQTLLKLHAWSNPPKIIHE